MIYFSQAISFGQKMAFIPQLANEWENIDSSTKQNSTFVWSNSIEGLMLEYAEVIGWRIQPTSQNWYVIWHDEENEPIGKHWANTPEHYMEGAINELSKLLLA